MSCSRHSSAIDFGPRNDASTISVFWAGTIHVARSWDPEHGPGDTKSRNRRKGADRGGAARAPCR